MVRIILKNGDILEYPNATSVNWEFRNGIMVAIPTDRDDNEYMGTFNVNNIAGWDYGNIL